MTIPLTIVVPARDEGPNLRSWWEAARLHLPAGAVVRLVYDSPDDDTLPVARALAASGAPIECLPNAGTGALAAVVTGLRSAARGAVVVSMADLSDDLATLGPMLDEYARGAAVVVASRYMPGGHQDGGPWLKGRLARWASLALHRIVGFPVRDATNSFRLYDAALARSIAVESTGGFEVAFEITVKAWQRGARVVEVPTTWRERARGRSRFKLWRWLPRYARWWFEALAWGVRHGGARLPRER